MKLELNDPTMIDGAPKEVARATIREARELCEFAEKFGDKADKMLRNASLSRLLNEGVTQEELGEEWEASWDFRLLRDFRCSIEDLACAVERLAEVYKVG